MFYPIPLLLFDCLEFREVSQKEQTQRTKINFSSLLKVTENKGFIERKREVVSFSRNDKASVDSFLQEEVSRNVSFTRFYASVAQSLSAESINHSAVFFLVKTNQRTVILAMAFLPSEHNCREKNTMPRKFLRAIWNQLSSK